MADKFPELEDDLVQDGFVTGDGDETEFLRREAEILGDEFKTEQDSELLSKNDSDSKTLGTSVNEADAIAAASYQPQDVEGVSNPIEEEEDDDEFGEPQSSSAEPVVRGKSEALENWKARRELEISERDQAEDQAKADLQEEAAKHIDDFYENYNIKKQQGIDQTQKEAEEFLAKTHDFASQDLTVWDKALQLINLEDADIVDGRDRSKFKEILQRLKGNESAPGATGQK
ncbi:Clc1 [Kluyveromyces lactis]|nr:Clc1 [Kluyveromyces lactis]